ncbi:MAG: hypothetical protein KJ064_02360 [Anaerolineae bacterium]|jgi:hypothetical protein|nr:hypothetical protein [Anaerolineae bacterium]
MVSDLFGLAVLFHGLGHIMGFLAAWTDVPQGFNENPWIISHHITIKSPLGRVFGLLWLAALVLWLGAGLGHIAGEAWWDALAVSAAAMSMTAILPWWNTITPGARWGATLFNLLVLIIVFQNV